MGLPKILYHGTSEFRLQFSIRGKGLKGDVVPNDRIDRFRVLTHPKKIFLTESFRQAAMFSLLTLANDRTMPQTVNLRKIDKGLYLRHNFGAVISIMTSKYPGAAFVPDSDGVERMKVWRRLAGERIFDEADMQGDWYIYQGNMIPIKHFGPMRQVSDNMDDGKDDRFYQIYKSLYANFTEAVTGKKLDFGEQVEMAKAAVKKLDDMPADKAKEEYTKMKEEFLKGLDVDKQ